MKAFLLLVIVIWTGGIAALAIPPMPADPYSDSAFETIKDFYGLQQGLPIFNTKSISTETKASYILQTVQLTAANLPEVTMVLKIPKTFSPPLSAVVLFTGFQTGAQSLDLVGDPENSIYVGFQYPWPIEFNGSNLKWDWRRMEQIPVLMSGALAWLYHQSFIDQNKINIINVSFGTLFYPLAQRFLNEIGFRPKAVVFGYGGVDFAEIIGQQLATRMGMVELAFVKSLLQQQSWVFEPKYHIRHLSGPFLMVNGESDTVFPAVSREGLSAQLQEPKKIVVLPGPHIQPDQTAVIQSFLREVQTFFRENNAL